MHLLHLKLIIGLEEVGHLTFNRWLPHEPDDRIRFEGDGFRGELSFPPYLVRSLLPAGRSVTDRVNVTVRHVLAEVEFHNWSLEMVEFTKLDSNVRSSPEQKDSQEGLISKFNEVRDVIVGKLNRLISCARFMKGQFWATEIVDSIDGMGNFFNRAEIAISYDGASFQLFELGGPIVLLGVRTDVPKLISREDWPRMLEFVEGSARPHLAGSLLANARELLSKGYRRSALLEATTALEVSLAQFIRQSKDGPLPPSLEGRLEVNAVDDLLKKVGLRGAFGLVLPLLFPDDEMPADMLSKCREAIDERNRVVHQGKRDVSNRKLIEWFPAIDTCCRTLCGPDGWYQEARKGI